MFTQGLAQQGGEGKRLGSPSGKERVTACPNPASLGHTLSGLRTEPRGAALTTPTEVKAATELMIVGMMSNLPACVRKDPGEWAQPQQVRGEA